MMKSKKILSFLLAVMLVIGVTPLTAFAYGGDDTATNQTVEASSGEESTEETDTADSSEDADEEVPYTYTIDEDGSITITINGQEWNIEADEEESKTTGKVVTRGSRLNLRTGAGMNYEIIDQLRPGEEVTVIGTEGDWYKVIVPEKTGYVHSDYLELLEEADENSEIDSAMLMLLLNMMFQNMTESEPQASFTPTGNLTLIDDILQTEVYATEDTELQEKQFITLQSKSGNYFYLVIDRTGDTENVYFMNLVDEADLMALIEENENGAAAPVCSCKDKCAVGAINTGCEICRTNMSECVGVEPKPDVEPTEPTEPVEEPEAEPAGNPMMVILILALLGGGGAFAYIKFFKNKPTTKGNADLDDYDYGDDDEDAMDAEWESEDGASDAESEDETV